MTDQFAWWRKALEMGGGRELTRQQLDLLGLTQEPQSGFYRCRSHKDGPFVPVAIWRDGEALWCLQENRTRDDVDMVFTWCARWPISKALYDQIMAGGAWPDEPPSPPKDHNQIKTGDPCIDLQAEFEAERELAQIFLKKPITTQEQADQAAIWAKKLAAIAKKATDLHKVEKQPSLDEGRRIDDKWRTLKEEPADLSKKLKRAQDDFLRELDRLEQERQRKAREEADRVRREAEEATRRAAEASRIAEQERARREQEQPGAVASLFADETNAEADRLLAEAERKAKEAAAAEREAEARAVGAGRTGARTSLRTYYSAHITDYDALVMALKDTPEVREAVERVANQIARSKDAPMPAGAERHEERRAA